MKNFHKIKILAKRKFSLNLYHFSCEVPVKMAKTFLYPGQFIQLKDKDKIGFFALANHPKQKIWEFLIKTEDNIGKEFGKKKEGEYFLCTFAQGKGFLFYESYENIKPENIFLFSMGSGIAPLRSLLKDFFLRKEILKNTKINFFQFSISENHLPFFNEYKTWQDLGINLKYFSLQNRDNLQNLLKKNRSKLPSSIILWCGSIEFGKVITNFGKDIGLKKEQMIDNLE